MLESGFSTNFFPIVVAHRGASAKAAENSPEAFRSAFAAGAQVIELDARLTADQVAVVAHDPGLSRITGGKSEAHINDLTLAQLRALHPGIATVGEIVRLAEEAGGGVDIELKNLAWEAAFDPGGRVLVEAVLTDLESFEGPLLLSSFDGPTLDTVRNLAPSVATGILGLPDHPASELLEFAAKASYRFVLPNVKALTASGSQFVESAHDRGLLVGTWVVNEPDKFGLLLSWGVDAIASDDPEAVVPVLNRFRGLNSRG